MSARIEGIRAWVVALVTAAAIVVAVAPGVAQAAPNTDSGGKPIQCEAPGGGLVNAGDEVTIVIKDKKTGKTLARHEYICGNDGKMHEVAIKGRVAKGRAVVVSTVVTARR